MEILVQINTEIRSQNQKILQNWFENENQLSPNRHQAGIKAHSHLHKKVKRIMKLARLAPEAAEYDNRSRKVHDWTPMCLCCKRQVATNNFRKGHSQFKQYFEEFPI
jgi:hypothetical protein